MSHLSTSVLEHLWFGDGSDEEAESRARESLAAHVAKVHGVKPIPAAARKLLALTRGGAVASPAEVAAVVETDAALSVRFLRVVNSSATGLRIACTSIQHAAALLGPGRAAEIAMAASVVDLFDDQSGASRDVLSHASRVAGVARRLARRCEVDEDVAFTTGLLHDLGKLMMLRVDSAYEELVTAWPAGDDLCVAEREKYGFDHGVLAAEVLASWQIPSPVPEIIGLHHQSARAEGKEESTLRAVHLLRVANAVSRELSSPVAPAEFLARMEHDPSMGYLELSAIDLGHLWGELRKADGGTLSADEAEAPEAGARDHEDRPSIYPPSGVRRSRPPYHPPSLGAVPACMVCQEPAGNLRCGRCGGPLCESHRPDARRYCERCEEAYRMYASSGAERPLVRALPASFAVAAVTLGALALWVRAHPAQAAGALLGFAMALTFFAGLLLLRTAWQKRARRAAFGGRQAHAPR